jgi:Galactosyltransferase
MRKQDYILLIMNCEKYKYKAETQRNGWLKCLNNHENIIYYHVIGKETLESEFYFDDSNNILYVKTCDDYISLPHKVIMSYLAIIMTFQFKYIFKTDDDQMLTDAYFFNKLLLQIQNNNPDYGGRLITIQREHISIYYYYHPELPRNILVKACNYCNGRFYILSKKSVLDLLEKMDDIKKEYFEDYAIGYYLCDELKSNFLPIYNDVFVDFV